jgi:hypothetical protein
MLKVFAVPLAIRTPPGSGFARFASAPCEAGELWWVIDPGDGDRCFTAMLPNLEPIG